jgi:hypothetical protein
MPKIFMRKTQYGEERIVPVEEHSVKAREEQGWTRVMTPAEKAKFRRDLTADEPEKDAGKDDKAGTRSAKKES